MSAPQDCLPSPRHVRSFHGPGMAPSEFGDRPEETSTTRRRFLQGAGVAAGTLVLSGIAGTGSAHAAAKPPKYHSDGYMGFYHSVAAQYTIADQNFCSEFGPTDPNRKYLWSGTANGDESNYSRPRLTVAERRQQAGIVPSTSRVSTLGTLKPRTASTLSRSTATTASSAPSPDRSRRPGRTVAPRASYNRATASVRLS